MGLLNVIRKLRLRQGLAIREIERRTGVSRNTIKKYLKADVIEPKFATPERSSKLDPFAETLAGWLKTNAKKGRKDRHTLKKMHADLVALGFTGSYNRVAAFARQWRADRQRDEQTTGRGTFVPLAFRPGEAFQFDWSEDFAVIGGERMKLQMAHIKLSHSRAFLLRAYPLQTHEMLFDAHWHAFRVFGGVPERGIYDNMKTAVDLVGRGKARQVNIRFLAMANHYVFEPDFCNPAAGWEKGQVEKNVRDSRHQMLQGMPDFPDLAALNDWLEQRCVALWHETAHGTLSGTIADVWAEERAALMPLPVAFDGFIEISKRVSPTCLISFERNRYSVPASFANRPVSLRVYPDRLVVAAAGQFRAGLTTFAQARPVHGECGGYMALGAGLVAADGTHHQMVGLLGLETSFAKRRMHLGYRLARPLHPLPGQLGMAVLRGHEFHYATILSQPDPVLAAVEDANGDAVPETGSCRQTSGGARVSGTFFHLISPASPKVSP